jgi:hypothetical protein
VAEPHEILTLVSERASIEIVSDTDPISALDRVIEIATPALALRGYELEGRGNDWAHWTRGFKNVIRAYAFQQSGEGGVRLLWQGDVPVGTVEKLARKVIAATGWSQR